METEQLVMYSFVMSGFLQIFLDSYRNDTTAIKRNIVPTSSPLVYLVSENIVDCGVILKLMLLLLTTSRRLLLCHNIIISLGNSSLLRTNDIIHDNLRNGGIIGDYCVL